MQALETGTRILEGNPKPRMIAADPGVRPMALRAAFNGMDRVYRAVGLTGDNLNNAEIAVASAANRSEARTVLGAAVSAVPALEEIRAKAAQTRPWSDKEEAAFNEENARRRSMRSAPVTLYDANFAELAGHNNL